MKYVTISDCNAQNQLAFDLSDLLLALGDIVLLLEWQVRDVECVGRGISILELEQLSDAGSCVSGEGLTQIACQIDQTIDGEFIGRSKSSGSERVVIRAVDSSYFDVAFDDPNVLTQLRGRFDCVSDPEEWSG